MKDSSGVPADSPTENASRVTPELFRVGECLYRPRTGEITKGATTHRLRPQAARAFEFLISRAGQLVGRDEFIAELWPHGHIEGDLGLNACVRQIRAALGDDAAEPRFIETLRARGYRLIATVEEIESDSSPGDHGRAPSHQAAGGRIVGSGWSRVALAAIVIPFLAYGLVRSQSTSVTAAPPIRLAVLPVTAFSPDTTGAPFRLGLTEDLLTALANANPDRLLVVGRASVAELQAKGLDGPAIAERLSLDYLLSGTLRTAANGYRLSVQLLRTDGDVYAWSEGIDLDEARLDGIHRVVAGGVLDALQLAPINGAVTTATSTRIHGALLRARYLREQFSRDHSERAIQILQDAMGTDSSDAPALVEVARNRLILGDLQGADNAINRARSIAFDAPGLDHVAGRVALYGRVDLEGALHALGRAVRLQPGTPEVRHDYAQALAAAGRLNEAAEQARIAKQLDPLSSIVLGDMGWVFYYAGKFDEAFETCGETLELRPESDTARKCVVLAAAARGSVTDAAAHIGALVSVLGGSDSARIRLEQAARDGAGETVWLWIDEQSRRIPFDPVDLARNMALLGRFESADSVLALLPARALGTLLAHQDPLFRSR